MLPSLSFINLDSPLSSYTDLQHVLFEEERTAYNQAILQNTRWYLINLYTLILGTYMKFYGNTVLGWDRSIELIEVFLISYAICFCFVGMGKCIHSLSYTTLQLIRLPCASWLSIGKSMIKMPVYLLVLFLLVCSFSIENYYFLVQFKSCNQRTSRSTKREWNSGMYQHF